MATRMGRTITRDVLSKAAENPNSIPKMGVGTRLINPGVSTGRAAAGIGNSPVRWSQSTIERRTGKRKSGAAGH